MRARRAAAAAHDQRKAQVATPRANSDEQRPQDDPRDQQQNRRDPPGLHDDVEPDGLGLEQQCERTDPGGADRHAAHDFKRGKAPGKPMRVIDLRAGQRKLPDDHRPDDPGEQRP